MGNTIGNKKKNKLTTRKARDKFWCEIAKIAFAEDNCESFKENKVTEKKIEEGKIKLSKLREERDAARKKLKKYLGEFENIREKQKKQENNKYEFEKKVDEKSKECIELILKLNEKMKTAGSEVEEYIKLWDYSGQLKKFNLDDIPEDIGLLYEQDNAERFVEFLKTYLNYEKKGKTVSEQAVMSDLKLENYGACLLNCCYGKCVGIWANDKKSKGHDGSIWCHTVGSLIDMENHNLSGNIQGPTYEQMFKSILTSEKATEEFLNNMFKLEVKVLNVYKSNEGLNVWNWAILKAEDYECRDNRAVALCALILSEGGFSRNHDLGLTLQGAARRMKEDFRRICDSHKDGSELTLNEKFVKMIFEKFPTAGDKGVSYFKRFMKESSIPEDEPAKTKIKNFYEDLEYNSDVSNNNGSDSEDEN